MTTFAKTSVIACLLVGLVCFAGCGSDDGHRKVTGKVTMNGEPVDGAALMFYAQDSTGEGGGGKTDASGNYSITAPSAVKGGLFPGEYKVTIAKYSEVVDEDQQAFESGEITYDELQERKAAKGPYGKAEVGELLTPAQYSNTNATPLTVTVTDDPKQNVFDFDLTEE